MRIKRNNEGMLFLASLRWGKKHGCIACPEFILMKFSVVFSRCGQTVGRFKGSAIA